MVEEKKNLGETSIGMQPNMAGLLSYLLGWITGLIFYLVEKKNKFVRFHAMQSIVVFGGIAVLNIVLLVIPVLGVLLSLLLSLLGIVLWVLLMIKAYQGEFFKLPIAGDIAEKNS
ncbi:MAG: DUF4870 domain-containing protein [Candidatus Omnitrophica bacterium]|nr:DUF4870 domain-containing protein [Candidatus Omnitrophota bacterium]